MCNAVFFAVYLVDTNNSDYYHYDSLYPCFPYHSWFFLYLWNILIACFCLFSTHWGCFKYCCSLPGGCGKPETVIFAVHWQSRNLDPCTEVVLGMLWQRGTNLLLPCLGGDGHLTHAHLPGSILTSFTRKYLFWGGLGMLGLMNTAPCDGQVLVGGPWELWDGHWKQRAAS